MQDATSLATLKRSNEAHEELIKRLRSGVAGTVKGVTSNKRNEAVYGWLSIINVLFDDDTEVNLTFKSIEGRDSNYKTSYIRYVLDIKSSTGYYAKTPRVSEVKKSLDFDKVIEVVKEEAERARRIKKNTEISKQYRKVVDGVISNYEKDLEALKEFCPDLNRGEGTLEAPEFKLELRSLNQEKLARVMKALKEVLL
jgi:hypothetical protein